MSSSYLIVIIRCATALVMGGALLWQVVKHADSRAGQAVVHVMDCDVDVRIDDREYSVDLRIDAPLACELRPGSHTLRMFRCGKVLYEEEFTVVPGEDVILTAWEAR